MNRIMAYIYPDRADKEAHMNSNIDCRRGDEYLARKNSGREKDKYIYFHLILAAMATYFILSPRLRAYRLVRVLPEARMPESKTIFLSFDDGPGPYTEALLNVLRAYGAKATFFVTGQDEKFIPLIGREIKEGHAVGVHTLCHDYSLIYSSEQAYFDDFFAMEDIIWQQSGVHTKLFRFPGGSSNTVSSFNRGIMTRLSGAMTDMGYKYFDWNVDSRDAGGTKKTDKIVKNIIRGCKHRKYAIVLQHDIKDYSVAAVEKVLVWGKANGYTFAALDMESPYAHHRLNN